MLHNHLGPFLVHKARLGTQLSMTLLVLFAGGLNPMPVIDLVLLCLL
jgi:hypothetical protein